MKLSSWIITTIQFTLPTFILLTLPSDYVKMMICNRCYSSTNIHSILHRQIISRRNAKNKLFISPCTEYLCSIFSQTYFVSNNVDCLKFLALANLWTVQPQTANYWEHQKHAVAVIDYNDYTLCTCKNSNVSIFFFIYFFRWEGKGLKIKPSDKW